MLFAMLARAGQDVPRDQVLEHLWPDMDEDRARNNLYVAWSTMKSVLGGDGSAGEKSPYVENAHGVCRADSDTVRSDIDEFEEALACARQAEADSDIGTRTRGLRARSRRSYRGDLLPGDVYDDWFASIRAHYRSVYVDAMRAGGDASAMPAETGSMRWRSLRRATQADSLREDLYQMQMRCEIAGRPAQLRDRHVLPLQRQTRRGTRVSTPRLRRVRSTTRSSRWRTGPCQSRSTHSRSRTELTWQSDRCR